MIKSGFSFLDDNIGDFNAGELVNCTKLWFYEE